MSFHITNLTNSYKKLEECYQEIFIVKIFVFYACDFRSPYGRTHATFSDKNRIVSKSHVHAKRIISGSTCRSAPQFSQHALFDSLFILTIGYQQHIHVSLFALSLIPDTCRYDVSFP